MTLTVLVALVNGAVGFIMFGGGLALAAAIAVADIRKYSKLGMRSEGTITGYEDEMNFKVVFTTADGQTITGHQLVTSSVDTNLTGSLTAGNRVLVNVAYSADDPSKFIILNKKPQNLFVTCCFIAFGLFFAGVGVTGLLGYHKLFDN